MHLDLKNGATAGWLRDSFPDVVAGHLLRAETRPRCERFGDGHMVNLRGVNLNEGAEIDDMVSLRVWMTADLLVTGRLRPLRAAQAVHDSFDALAPTSPLQTLLAIANGLTARIDDALAELDDKVDALEDEMFERTDLGPRATLLRKQVIKLRRFVAPQRAALIQLASDPVVDEASAAVLRENINQATHNVEALDAARDRLMILQEHMAAHRDARLGRNSYILSVAAAIFLPLGFLTGLFGVNVGGMPGLDSPAAFWSLALACVAFGGALSGYFRWRGWL